MDSWSGNFLTNWYSYIMHIPGAQVREAVGLFSNMSRYTKELVYKSVTGNRHYSDLINRGLIPSPITGYAPRPLTVSLADHSICPTVDLYITIIYKDYISYYIPHYKNCISCRQFVNLNP